MPRVAYHHPKFLNQTVAMADFKPHVPRAYRFMATGLGASMWFWLMWRAKKDGPVLLGWKHPWDH
ncbi:hypothetical protein B0T25DRAFT_92796, partial [Lasiosphaeria hispida]